MKISKIYDLLESVRLSATDEYELQNNIADVFHNFNIAFEREVNIGPRERIDFMIEDIGIEIKIQGSGVDVFHQLQRYVLTGKVSGLILITTKTNHKGMIPEKISNIPVQVIELWKNRL